MAFSKMALHISHSLDLLLKSALCKETEAVLAWKAWRSQYNIDATPWNEVRILGVIAGRIDSLELNSPIRARLMGIRKFLWVQTQFCIQKTWPALKCLHDGGIPILLLKGAARIAREPSCSQERLIRDIDVLVPIGLQSKAIEILLRSGWKLTPQPWQLASFKKNSISGHHAWSFECEGGEIDLHHYSNNLNRLRGDDEKFWEYACALNWGGIAVQVLDPSHDLLTTLVHGVRWSIDGAADWAIDACAYLDDRRLDWDEFLRETEERLLQAIVFRGLSYLRDSLGKEIPLRVFKSLSDQIDKSMAEELDYFYGVTEYPKTTIEVRSSYELACRRAKKYSSHDANELVEALEFFTVEYWLAQNESLEFSIDFENIQTNGLIFEIHLPVLASVSLDVLMGKFSCTGLEVQYAGPDRIMGHDINLIAVFRLQMDMTLLLGRNINDIHFSYFLGCGTEDKLPLKVSGYYF